MKKTAAAAIICLAVLVLALVALTRAPAASTQQPTESSLVRYNEKGELLRPEGWERWVLVGSSLGLGYGPNESPIGSQAFHHVLMEPSAYQHYRETGEFKEKTVFALAIYSQGRRESIGRQGSFTKDFMALEIALKDHERFPEGWAYFDFGGGSAPSAGAFNPNACHSCHVRNGGKDNVFTQFYPLLSGD